MGLEKTHGRNYDLGRLLNAVDAGKIALPEFQRDFVWDSLAIRQLLSTCLSGWPIGSLLLLPGNATIFFQVREIKGAPTLKASLQSVVLDGQQRLTALYQALFERGDERFAVDIDAMEAAESIDDIDEAIVAIPRGNWATLYETPQAQFDGKLIPVSVLRRASDFYRWRDEATSPDQVDARKRLTDLFVDHLSGLENYEIPAVVIDEEVSPEAIARIFERVNRLGEPLGTFDLMVAKSFAEDFNLRDKWDALKKEQPRLASFLGKDGGLAVLTVVALFARDSVRQADVLALTGPIVRSKWDEAVAATMAAVELLQSRLGVLDPDWLPYKVMLTVLGALAMERDLESLEPRIREWYWSSAFTGRYDVASNTRALEDYRALSDGTGGWPGIGVSIESMIASNRRQYGALHRAFLCLLGSRFGTSIEIEAALEAGESTKIATANLFERDPDDDEQLHLRTLGVVLLRGQHDQDHWLSPPQDVKDQQFLADGFSRANWEAWFLARLTLMAVGLTEAAQLPVALERLEAAES